MLYVLGLGASMLAIGDMDAYAEMSERNLQKANMSPWIFDVERSKQICSTPSTVSNLVMDADFHRWSQCYTNFSITDSAFSSDSFCAPSGVGTRQHMQVTDGVKQRSIKQACNISTNSLNMSDK